MQDKQKKNHKILIISLGVLLVLLIGGTLAYYSTTDLIPNIFHTKEYSSKSIETFTSPNDWKPGDSTNKSIIVENNGDLCENVRVNYSEKWVSKNGDELPTTQNGAPLVNVKLTNETDWIKEGNYYYYNKTLQSGEKTSSFIKSVSYSKNAQNDYDCTNENNKIICSSSGDGYDGATYTLTVNIETMYCETSAEAWGVNVNTLEASYAVLDIGHIVNTKMRTITQDVGVADFYDNYIDHHNYGYEGAQNIAITNFKRAGSLPVGFVASSDNTVSSGDSKYPIYMWFDDTDGTMYYYSEAEKILLNEDSSWLFFLLLGLDDFSFLSEFDTSHVKNMWAMLGSTNIESLDALADWDTSNVTNMANMFFNCESITSLQGLKNWNVSKVTNFSEMFYYCESMISLEELAKWDTGNATNMEEMFVSCRELLSLHGLENWDTSNVTNMGHMFKWCDKVTSLDALSNWNTSNVTNMEAVFFCCTGLTSLQAIEDWEISSVTTIAGMFGSCSGLTTLQHLADWDVSSVTIMEDCFEYCTGLITLQGLEDWTTSNVENFKGMFAECSDVTTLQAIEDWNTSSALIMAGMFNGCTGLSTLQPLAGWNVSSVTDMSDMFYSCRGLTNLQGLSSWNTSSVDDMSCMFWGCTGITDASAINDWNIANVNDFGMMFRLCPSHPTFTKRAGTWNSGGTFIPS